MFLLDEPLVNLVAALRQSTRGEIRALQRRLGATTVFVTHDQAEAMAISDRVAVMFDGVTHQIGTPDKLYRRPASLRVARFLTQPLLNELPAAMVKESIGTATRDSLVHVAGKPLEHIDGIIAVRPEHAELRAARTPGLSGIPVTVEEAEHGGGTAHAFAHSDNGARLAVRVASVTLAQWPPGKRAVFGFTLDAALPFIDDAADYATQAAA